MKKELLFTLIILVFATTPTWAHPPKDIDLQYNSDNGNLVVDIKHVSRDHRNHYIAKIDVLKGSIPIATKRFKQQIKPSGFRAEIPVDIEEDTNITVKAQCREGGSKEVSLTLTKEILEEEVTKIKKPSRSATTSSSKNKSAVLSEDSENTTSAVTRDSDKTKAAFTTDPKVAKPAVPKSTDIQKSAVGNSDVSIPTTPSDTSKIKPAQPLSYP